MAKEKTELIEDFSGGLNQRLAPNRIDPKQSAACANVWNDSGALIKRFGSTVAVRTLTSSVVGSTFFGRAMRPYANYSATPPVDSLVMIGLAHTSSNTGFPRHMMVYTKDAAATVQEQGAVAAGTISGTATTNAVTGVGTAFTSYAVGDIIRPTTAAEFFVIASITNDTNLTIEGTIPGTFAANAFSQFASWPTTALVSFVEMNSYLWISGQGHTTARWNGSAFTYVAAFPQASYNLQYKNYVFAGNTAANPARLAWSALKDPTTWSGSNFVDVNPDDGQPIVGLFNDGNSIVILKTASAYKLTGDIFDPANPTYTLTQISVPQGFLINSARTAKLYRGRYVMVGARGFYSYAGGSSIEYLQVSELIKDEWANLKGFAFGSQPTPANEPSAAVVDGRYWALVESDTFSHTAGNKNAVLVLDDKEMPWIWNTAESGSAGANASGMSDLAYYKNRLYGVSIQTAGLMNANTGNTDMYRLDGTNNFGSAINGTQTSKVFQFDTKQRFGLAYLFYKKRDIVAVTGTVSTEVASQTVTGSGTNFLSTLLVGDTITVNGVTGTISSIGSDTSIFLSAQFGALNTGVAYTVAGTRTLTFEYSIDEGSFTSVSIELTTGTGTRIKSAPIIIGRAGNTIQFRISNNIAGITFEVYAIQFNRIPLRQ